MDIDLDKLLETAKKAAREAGALALELRRKTVPKKWKGKRDVVNSNIIKVQDLIIETILGDYPDHAILSEELEEAPNPDSEFLWTVDPIDGSLNYVRGIPFYSIAIGFRHQGTHRVGVVYDPNRDELFHGIDRRGAFVNDKRIITNKTLEGMEAYMDGHIATDWPADIELRPKQSMIIDRMGTHVTSVQILGSPALALSYIAAGRLDAYFNLQLDLWDIAPGIILVNEAGGAFTNILGSTWQFSDGGYLASNGIIHGKMLAPITYVLQPDPEPEPPPPPLS